MTTYTPQQIADAHLIGVKAGNESGHEVGGIAWVAAYRDAYTEALGLTVEPEKPAPGVYLTRKGIPLFVGNAGVTHAAGAVGLASGGLETFDIDGPGGDITPARVVPAAPVELTKRQVGEIYEQKRVNDPDGPAAYSLILDWKSMGEFQKDNITATVNAALKEYTK